MVIDQSGNVNAKDLNARTIIADTVIARSIEQPVAVPAPTAALERREQAYNLRVKAAYAQYKKPLPAHPNNGDEDTLEPAYIGNYT